MLSEEQYDRIVGAIYEAALDSTRWIEVVEQVTRAFAVVGTSVYTPFAAKHGLEPVWSTDADPEFIAEYASKYASEDILTEALWRRVPVANIIYSWDEMVDTATLKSWPGYRDLLAPRGVHDGIGLIVGADDHRAGQIMIYTPQWNADEIAAAKQVMARLSGHLTRAMRVHWHLSAARQAADTAQVTLDMFSAGVCWLSAEGQVLYRNAEMDRMLALADGIAVQGERLRLADRGNQAEVLTAVGEALNGRQSALLVHRPSHREAFRLTVSPLPLAASALRLPKAAAIAFFSEAPLAEASVNAVAKRFALTPAETRVLQMLVAGRDVQAASTEIGSSVATVRTQVKSILAKCGVSRQADLIRLVAGFPRIGRSDR